MAYIDNDENEASETTEIVLSLLGVLLEGTVSEGGAAMAELVCRN